MASLMDVIQEQNTERQQKTRSLNNHNSRQ